MDAMCHSVLYIQLPLISLSQSSFESIIMPSRIIVLCYRSIYLSKCTLLLNYLRVSSSTTILLCFVHLWSVWNKRLNLFRVKLRTQVKPLTITMNQLISGLPKKKTLKKVNKTSIIVETFLKVLVHWICELTRGWSITETTLEFLHWC